MGEWVGAWSSLSCTCVRFTDQLRWIYYMTRTTPRALSLQNYWENPRMRAVRDGASRSGKSRPDLLRSRRPSYGNFINIAGKKRTKTTLLLYKSNFSVKMSNIPNFVTRKKNNKKKKWKKEKGKAWWSYNKMLIDWVRSGRTGKYLALGHGARTSLRSVRTPWPRAKYFPVRPSHSVNKYIFCSNCYRWFQSSCLHTVSILNYVTSISLRWVSTNEIVTESKLHSH